MNERGTMHYVVDGKRIRSFPLVGVWQTPENDDRLMAWSGYDPVLGPDSRMLYPRSMFEFEPAEVHHD